ncbi:hypothetical protein MMC18_009233 [Xylographa bjoerkii]|nr:hypothetical protein [Xylographa bjoerkii]
MAPRNSIGNTPPGRLLGRTFEEWIGMSYKNGIMAVIDRWGNPNSYKKNQRKAELMALAWTALQNFNPMPLPADVEGLICNAHPAAQRPAPRSTAGPSGTPGTPGLPGIPDTPGTPGTPIDVDAEPIRGSSSGHAPSGLSSAGGTSSGRAPTGTSSAGNTPGGPTPSGTSSTGNTPGGRTPSGLSSATTTPNRPPSTGNTPSGRTPSGLSSAGNTPIRPPSTGNTPSGHTPEVRETPTRVRFTINKRPIDPQQDDGLQITQGHFEDQLAGLLLRYFHRVPAPSIGGREEGPPVRPASDLGNVRRLQLDDAFDNQHDPNITSFRLSFRNFPAGAYLPAEGDRDYPNRGRGPVWRANSCALDTVIVAARLLDIGHIEADTGLLLRDHWVEQLQPFARACVQLFRARWEIFTEAESIRRRDEFFQHAIAESQRMGPASRLRGQGLFQSSIRFWDLCTEMADQFNYRQFSRSFCTSCQRQLRMYPASGGPLPPVGSLNRDVAFDEVGANLIPRPDMQQMFQRHFGAPNPSRNHQGCTGQAGGQSSVQRGRRIVSPDGLPVRLVVKPSVDYRDIPGATNDRITFTYSTLEGVTTETVDGQQGPWQQGELRQRTATYRWLGGIYEHGAHYRVYWQDSDYVTSNGNVKVYDGRLFSGAILGEFPPHAAGSKVPALWARGADMLFYELINEDNRDDIAGRAQTVLIDTLVHVGKYDKREETSQREEPQKPAEEQHTQGKKRRAEDDHPYDYPSKIRIIE